MTPPNLYKLIRRRLSRGPYSNFDFTPYLPKKGRPGMWLPKRHYIRTCHSGWHYCVGKQEIKNYAKNIHHLRLDEMDLYIIEIRGDSLRGYGKSCAQEMRLLKKVRL
jgi:hypothetical protein